MHDAAGDTVICAVSGGADSVCMLHILLSLRATLDITVEAAHFNHQRAAKNQTATRRLSVRSAPNWASCSMLITVMYAPARQRRTNPLRKRRVRFATRSSLPCQV